MNKRQHQLMMQWFNAGTAAYHAGTARDDYPAPDFLRRSGLDIAWQTGWDTGLFCDAFRAGAAAAADAVCPYIHPETAAHWVQGWRINHDFAVIHGKKNPASRSIDAKPGHVSR